VGPPAIPGGTKAVLCEHRGDWKWLVQFYNLWDIALDREFERRSSEDALVNTMGDLILWCWQDERAAPQGYIQ
ncbi:unnamed protein product, partial [Symbiodinium necroappetens]